MDLDEIGGTCPRCDGEFRPGTTVCPDCDIPLVGIDDDAPAAPPPAPPVPASILPIDASWIPRLVGFAAACTATIALEVAGSMVAALSLDPGAGPASVHTRIRVALQAATPTLAVVALVGALAVIGAVALGDRRTWARTLAFASAAVVGALAVGKGVTEVWWRGEHDLGRPTALATALLLDAAVVVTCAVAMWLVEGRTPAAVEG